MNNTVETNRRSDRGLFALGLAGVLVAIPWRWYHFSGFGLGDDVNDVHIGTGIMLLGGLDPTRSESYRMMTTGLRALLFAALGVNEVSLILLPFIFITLAHLVGVLFARDLFGGRGAFLISLFFLTSPFETLSATANVTDYIQGFFALLATWNCYLGYVRSRPLNMWIGAVAVMGGVLNKVSGLGVVPVFFLATLTSNVRRWIPFWVALTVGIGMLCGWDLWFSGKPLRWMLFNNFFEGYNFWKGNSLAERLESVRRLVAILPTYLLSYNHYGDRMFGFISWLALFGVVIALLPIARKHPARHVVLWYVVAYFLFIDLMPHKLTLSGYYSHYRVWRYLGQYAPAVYLGAVYLLEEVGARWSRFRIFAVLLGCCVAGHALLITPDVVRPSVDANRDGRELIASLRLLRPPPRTPIHVDFVRNMWVSALFFPEVREYEIRCLASFDREEKRRYLETIQTGIVITGGAALGWYGNLDLNFDIEDSAFSGPPHWRKLFEGSGTPQPWRREPLRVWEAVGH